MTRDVHSLEAEYEPDHADTDERVVIGDTCFDISDEPVCASTGDDEMTF